jgi:hypothetical protein
MTFDEFDEGIDWFRNNKFELRTNATVSSEMPVSSQGSNVSFESHDPENTAVSRTGDNMTPDGISELIPVSSPEGRNVNEQIVSHEITAVSRTDGDNENKALDISGSIVDSESDASVDSRSGLSVNSFYCNGILEYLGNEYSIDGDSFPMDKELVPYSTICNQDNSRSPLLDQSGFFLSFSEHEVSSADLSIANDSMNERTSDDISNCTDNLGTIENFDADDSIDHYNRIQQGLNNISALQKH